ncbi:hypothetical protein V8G54_017479 [Vigna mungo]|uniref:Uncharacterized protein n=1 Tax=Vigna mungo TaxID=3915 RepID=A0AAQ3S279_VIGMU
MKILHALILGNGCEELPDVTLKTLQEARTLLGKLEYQRGNVEGRAHTESASGSQHLTSLVLEAIYLKVKSLQKLGKFTEDILSYPNIQEDNKLQEIVSHDVELLPGIWKQAGCYDEAISAYRRALLSQWNLDNDYCARIQKSFVMFLLYSGAKASPPTLAVQIEGSYVPKNNLKETILLLMVLLRKFSLGKMKWDPSVMEHLTFALSICSQTSTLAKKIEDLMPGVYHRIWCCQNDCALSLLRKSLHKHERPNDLTSLLLAARISNSDSHLAAERVNNVRDQNEHLKGVALQMLGLCLGKQSKVASSDSERSRLHSKALESLMEAIKLKPNNSDLIFELAVYHAKHRNLSASLCSARHFFNQTGDCSEDEKLTWDHNTSLSDQD